MLSDLSAIGIECRSDVTPDRLFGIISRDRIEKSRFEWLLVAMGEREQDRDPFKVLGPLSDDVWHFDAEAINDHGDYRSIVEECCRLSKGHLSFNAIADYVDVANKTAWVELDLGTHTERVDLKVDNDWIDPKIFSVLQQHLARTGSQRRLAGHGLGQDLLFVCQTPDAIQRLNKVTGLRFVIQP